MLRYVNEIANTVQRQLAPNEIILEHEIVKLCTEKLPLWYQLKLDKVNSWDQLTKVITLLDQVAIHIDLATLTKNKKQRTKCFNCGKLGSHKAINCRALKRAEKFNIRKVKFLKDKKWMKPKTVENPSIDNEKEYCILDKEFDTYSENKKNELFSKLEVEETVSETVSS